MNQKLPEYLLGKYQLVGTVTFSVLFAVVFLNLSIPFSDTAWFGLGNSITFNSTIIFLTISICFLIISRVLMYRSKSFFDMTYLVYIIWCFLEVAVIAGAYTLLTENIHTSIPGLWVGNSAEYETWEIYKRGFAYSTISLGIPYLIAGMYFAIIDKNNTIRIMNYENVVTDEPTKTETPQKRITLHDNSGTLKLSISPDNLFYIESDDNYIKVWYTDNKGSLKQYMLRCRLKTVEDNFKDSGLIRCNRKYIVNINKVSLLHKENEGYVLDLCNEEIPPIPVTKTYVDSILAYFADQQPLMDPME